jgi:hypothetical protein
MNYHHNGAHASESSRAFDDEDDVRAYAHKRVDELISAQYADVDALPSEQRTTIIVDCAQELADVILEKIESGEPTDILTLGTSLIRGFLGERGFKASASAESLRRKPKGGEDQKERENKRLPNEARVRFSLTEKPKAPTFLLRDQYILGQATGLVARTKTGKTTALVEDALRLVTGRRDIGEHHPVIDISCGGKPRERANPLRVTYIGEDPLDQTKLMFHAACKHWRVSEEDIGERLTIISARDADVVVVRHDKGRQAVIIEPVMDALEKMVDEDGTKVLIVDPFVKSHAVPENDNTGMEVAAAAWVDLAGRKNIAVRIAFHTVKGAPDADVSWESLRGGSSIASALRSGEGMRLMTESEARDARVEPRERDWIVCRIPLGGNLSKPGGDGRKWFRKVSVGVDAIDENGRQIVWEAGALEPFQPEWEREEQAEEHNLTEGAIKLFGDMQGHREKLSNKATSPRHPTKVLIRGIAGRRRYDRKVEIERDLEALHKAKWLTVCSVTANEDGSRDHEDRSQYAA